MSTSLVPALTTSHDRPAPRGQHASNQRQAGHRDLGGKSTFVHQLNRF